MCVCLLVSVNQPLSFSTRRFFLRSDRCCCCSLNQSRSLYSAYNSAYLCNLSWRWCWCWWRVQQLRFISLTPGQMLVLRVAAFRMNKHNSNRTNRSFKSALISEKLSFDLPCNATVKAVTESHREVLQN